MKHDYEAHDEWQGKVYMIEGSNDKYLNLFEVTGYKEMLGLKGLNCYHDLRPFFEWEKIPETINIEESKKQRDVFDKQREYERSIRTLKREKMIAKKMGYEEDYRKASSKLSMLNKEYKAFLEKNDLNRNSNREYVSKDINLVKINKYNQQINDMKVGKFDISKYSDKFQTTTDDVILTPERKQHIIDRHPEVIEYIDKLEDILNNPSKIYEQLSKEDTIWIVKEYDKNIKVTLKLNTVSNLREKGYKNSIVQMQIMRESEINRNIKNGKAIAIFDKSDKK